ncbi:MAG: bifunctional folylpolyglutamate synthase/dihydrofolate synthase [Ruminococcaceae bacterium]|nr:bifunctional folylpolyglutamate synthase/dihydrofolate synthase [Oscillospiraceae bacterium]
MTYNQALEYIHSVCWMGSRPGLERITELCALMGNIQDKLKYIHVAGTNGKGSVCAMLTEIFIAQGLRVGTFTSPYVFRFNERMAFNAEPVSDEELAGIIEKIKPLADSMEDKPTEFELITAAALLWFYEKRCDIVILEAGMGGRLDSTNVIKTPLLSIITSVSLDHTAFLGDTKEKIAFEKAGIFKKNVPALFGETDPCCTEVILKKAKKTGCKAYPCNYSRLSDITLTLDGAEFNLNGYKKRFKLELAGGYQPKNAVLAITAAEMLGISEEAIYNGICRAKWRARFEVISKDPLIIYDGGHNPDGVEALCRTVTELFTDKVNILSGVMADKDYSLITRLLRPITYKAYCVTPNNPRALDSALYAQAFITQGVHATPFPDMASALKKALEDSKKEKRPLIAMGSLYMYEEFIKEYNNL